MEITTLWTLPPQPLPTTELEGPVFVTIWLFVSLFFCSYLGWLLKRSNRPTWPEFVVPWIGSLLLTLWYLIIAVDRWMHYDRRPMPNGYVLLNPVAEVFRVISTILLLWGTYTIVWKELEDRFEESSRGFWWFGAKVAIFVVSITSLFYLVLYLALAIVWGEFLSLNTIADVATKRTNFEVSMTAMFFALGLWTVAAATMTIFWKARAVDGGFARNRIVLWLATIMLLARSSSEFAFSLIILGPATRQSVGLPRDVSYGVLTSLYLGCICGMAWQVAQKHDTGSRGSRLVESDIRTYILSQLRSDTDRGRLQSPPFKTILEDVQANLQTIIASGPLSGNLAIPLAHKQKFAVRCLQKLEKDYGHLDPKEGNGHHSRSTTRLSAFFGRTSAQSGRKLGRSKNPTPDSNMGASNGPIASSSNLDMRNAYRRSTPSDGHVGPVTSPLSAGAQQNMPRQPSMSSMHGRWTPGRMMPQSLEPLVEHGYGPRSPEVQRPQRYPDPEYWRASTGSPMPGNWPPSVASPATSYAHPSVDAHIPLQAHVSMNTHARPHNHPQ